MPYINVVKVEPGDTMDRCVDKYLILQEGGLTDEFTVIELNGNQYPVGYFNRDNIDMFNLGRVTLSNLHALLGHGATPNNEQYKQHGLYFAEQIIERFQDDPGKAEAILKAFDELFAATTRPEPNKPGMPMFDEEAKAQIRVALEEKKAALGGRGKI